MKKSVIFAAMICASIILGTSCVKETKLTHEEQMKNSAITLYYTGVDHHNMAMGPAHIALRLNTLLYEADNHVDGPIDITDTESGGEYTSVRVNIGTDEDPTMVDCRGRLFGNAKFQIDNKGEATEKITITYPIGYESNAANDYAYCGKISFETGGKYLNDAGDATWNALPYGTEPYDMNKLRRISTYGDIYFDWSEYSIQDMSISASEFLCYYKSHSDKASVWDLYYWFAPHADYNSAPTYKNYISKELGHGGYSSGSIIKSSASEDPTIVAYQAVGTLVTKINCGMNSIKEGTEKVVSTAFSLINPESFPESTVTLKWSSTNENSCTDGHRAEMRYAGYIYHF